MTSQRRLTSSRANGAKSRGPLDPEARLRSARNNLRHGLLAKLILLKDEKPQVLVDLIAAFERDFSPSNEVERALVENLAINRWRLLRLFTIERANLQAEIDTFDSSQQDAATRAALAFRSLGDQSRSLDLLNRYEARFERQFARSLSLILLLGLSPFDGRGPSTHAENDFCHSNPVPISDTPGEVPPPANAA
jgi:hypothetical protein